MRVLYPEPELQWSDFQDSQFCLDVDSTQIEAYGALFGV